LKLKHTDHELQSKERVEQLLLEVSSKQRELKIGGGCKNFGSTNQTKESTRHLNRYLTTS
jgi:hypothetical protein